MINKGYIRLAFVKKLIDSNLLKKRSIKIIFEVYSIILNYEKVYLCFLFIDILIN
jgi:hypothetical protein